jgi:phage recombination protein Bet
MSNLITTQINQLAERFDLPQSEELYQVLKATAFKGEVSDAQLSALLIVAKQFGLNPWTKEIYAFPDKGGIVPVVGVDGWSRIINEHPQFDGEEFEYGPALQHKNKAVHEWIECVIYRKDRSKPTRIREYFDEVNRDSATPWTSHPKRMHRHKALIQCARLAFGFGGICDPDEAERIIENTQPAKSIDPATGEITGNVTPTNKAASLPLYTDEDFEKNMVIWRKVIASNKKDVAGVLATVASIATLTEDQVNAIKNIPAELAKAAGQRKPDPRTGPALTATYAEVADKLRKATTEDALNEAATLINAVPDEAQRGELNKIFDDCAATLN